MSAETNDVFPAPRGRWLAIGVLVLATLAFYGNSLRGPFVYDDVPAIPGNPTIRHLWPLSGVVMPQGQGGLTVSGRPVLNLSFALNYAVSGEEVWSYHAFNLLVHAGAALLLFGLVRRTLTRPPWRARFGAAAVPLSFAIAALWALHPLQTQAVTYTVQRAESLMGFFYLLTLYAFVRATDCHPLDDRILSNSEVKSDVCHLMDDKRVGRSRAGWLGISIAACALGMATKEVMATAPAMVLLYDQTFVTGGFRAAWLRRRGYYLGLAATWLLLGALVLSTGGNRGGTVGVGVGVPWWAYGLTQFHAITRYLALALWPHPLVFEYGTAWVQRTGDVLPYAAVVVLLLAATGVALWRRPAAGFLGAWFFGILAPTSLTPGTIQMIVEHRTYLPLAAVVTGVVLVAYGWLGRWLLVPVVVIAGVFGGRTILRNRDYASAVAIWSDTVTKRPENSRARDAFADVLANEGRFEEAIAQRRETVRLKPDEATFHYKLGVALAGVGQFAAAAACYTEAEHLQPEVPEFHYSHGLAFVRLGRGSAAVAEYETALRLRPDYVEAHLNLGNTLISAGQPGGAIAHYTEALRLKPDDGDIGIALGGALLVAGRAEEAAKRFRMVLGAHPDAIEARYGLANAFSALGRVEEALAMYEDVLRRATGHANAHFKLANLLVTVGRVSAAISHYEAAIRLNPDDAEAHHNLGAAYARLERYAEAGHEFETALRLKPDYPDARRHLEQVRTLLGR